MAFVVHWPALVITAEHFYGRWYLGSSKHVYVQGALRGHMHNKFCAEIMHPCSATLDLPHRLEACKRVGVSYYLLCGILPAIERILISRYGTHVGRR